MPLSELKQIQSKRTLLEMRGFNLDTPGWLEVEALCELISFEHPYLRS